MKEKMLQYKEKAKTFWSNRTKVQKGMIAGSAAAVIILIAVFALFASRTTYVPLYSDLSVQEVSQVKEELEARGVPYELEDGGTTITVPEDDADSLLVDLAGQGIPSSGSIDYSFFSENASWGITDNEFDMLKLDAMQTELANLIQGIDGIEHAEVMINMPEDPVFVNESAEEASASIVIHTQPGYEFAGNQIDALYHLVSKAVPNLPPENIAIMNQYFEYFDRSSQNGEDDTEAHTYQQTVKKDIERDIQRRLQQMLGTMVGMDNVIVSVTADIDFTEENRVEELVEPVDIDDMEGLPVSIETIQESYSGHPPPGGVAGTGDEDIPGYEEADDGDEGEYDMTKETINNEYNRIRREIAESPYKIRDLGIQVAIDSVAERDEDGVQYLSQQDQRAVEDGIDSILNSIISTSIDEEFDDVDREDNVSIVFQEFSDTANAPEPKSAIPVWVYVAGGILLLIILVLIILLRRNRKEEYEEIVEEYIPEEAEQEDTSEIESTTETEEVKRRKQLEKMAKENPEEFAKLLRGWIADD